MFYTIEFQTNGDVGSAMPFSFATEKEALTKYHEIMMYAENSQVEKHGAAIIDENLSILKAELGLRDEASENLPVFFALEFQTSEGTGSCIPMAYGDKADAWNKFYTVLAYAAKSDVEKHGAMIITSDLFKVDARLAERNVQPQPEPEPEPTPEPEA